MGRLVKSLIAVVGGTIVLGVTAALFQEREPRYHDQYLSQWLKISFAAGQSAEQREKAAAAVRAMGTNSLPLLLKWATPTPPTFRNRIETFLVRHRSISVPKWFRKWASKPADRTREYEAQFAFLILGSRAAPIIPNLQDLANRVPVSPHATWAVNTLADIGPQAVPALVTTLINTNPYIRSTALTALSKMGTNALPAIPRIIHLLKDPSNYVKERAADGLGELHVSPDCSIPALVESLQSPNPMLRFRAALALLKFGDPARVALPEIRRVASDEADPMRQQYLLQCISKIAPATTTNEPLPY